MKNFETDSQEKWVCLDSYNVTCVEGRSGGFDYVYVGPHDQGAQAILEPFAGILEPGSPKVRGIQRLYDDEEIGYEIVDDPYVIDDECNISSSGWRHAIWEFDSSLAQIDPHNTQYKPSERYLAMVFGIPPSSLAVVGLAKAVNIVRDNAPQYIPKLSEVIESLFKNMTSSLLPIPPIGECYKHIADPEFYLQNEIFREQLLQATEAFGEEWVKKKIIHDIITNPPSLLDFAEPWGEE